MLMLFCSPDSEELANYQLMSEFISDIPFFFSFSNEAKKKYLIGQPTQLVMFKKFENGRADYFSEDYSLKALNKFITQNRYPTVIPINNKYIRHVFHAFDPVLIIFYKRGQAES